MPVINITVGEMSAEKKKELIVKLTEASVEVTGAPEQAHTVLIHELPLDSMGIGKKTVAEIKAEKMNK